MVKEKGRVSESNGQGNNYSLLSKFAQTGDARHPVSFYNRPDSNSSSLMADKIF